MAKINGTLVLLTLGGDPVLHLQDATFDSSLTLADVTNKDSAGYAEYLENAGTLGATIGVDGFADFVAATGNVKELMDYIQARGNVAFVFGPTGSGNVNITGNCILDGVNFGSPNEEGATVSGSATVNGAWTVSTLS